MREDEPLDESELDRELQTLLTVNPSADFVARVRMSVSRQAVARRFTGLWFVGSAVATAAAIVMAISLSAPRESLNADDMYGAVPDSGRDIQLPSVSSTRPREQPERRIVSNHARRPPRTPQPVLVMVWREDVEGFEELVSHVVERRFEVVPNAAIPQESLLVTNVVIAPIVFEPIELSRMDEGAFQ
jgi:pimeloyl-ACP methyl ester carboxylesterase